jgi:hypothetical protein
MEQTEQTLQFCLKSKDCHVTCGPVLFRL